MKKLLLTLAFIVPMIFASCSKDDDGNGVTAAGNSLIGTWFAPEDSYFANYFGVVMVIESNGIWKSYETYEDYEDDYYTYGSWNYSEPDLVCTSTGKGMGNNMIPMEGEDIESATFKILSLTENTVSGEFYIENKKLGDFILYKNQNGDSSDEGNNGGTTNPSVNTQVLANLWMCVQYTQLTPDPETIYLNGSASGPNYNYIRFTVDGSDLIAKYYNSPLATSGTEYYFTLNGNKIYSESDLAGTILLCEDVRNKTGLEIVWEPNTNPFNPNSTYQRDCEYWLDTWSSFE